MSTATAISVADYLNTSYRPDCEYVDGELVERNVGEWDHSRLQALLIRHLMDREQQLGILVVPEQRVQVRPTRFRIPDITVLLGPRPVGGIVREPPFLCIEILSPGDRMQEMLERIDDYLSFGVCFVWLIDPRTQHAFIYTSGSVRDGKDGVLETTKPDIRVPLSELK